MCFILFFQHFDAVMHTNACWVLDDVRFEMAFGETILDIWCNAAHSFAFHRNKRDILAYHVDIFNNNNDNNRNMESFNMNVTCKLHGSPKNQATSTMSPLHRLQTLDLMDDIPLTYCKETSTNSPILTTPIIEHNKIMTPRRQANHHQLHAPNDDLSSNTTTNHKNKSYGGNTSGESISGANFVGSSTYNCDGMFGTSSSSNGASAHHQKQSSSASHSHHTMHRSYSQQEQPKLDDRCGPRHRWQACPELHKAMDGVNYIADHTRKEEESTKVNYYSNAHIHFNFDFEFPVQGASFVQQCSKKVT